MDRDGRVGQLPVKTLIGTMIIFMDAQKRACSTNMSGLVPREELRGSWEMYNQCQMWLREKYREIESAPAEPQKNASGGDTRNETD